MQLGTYVCLSLQRFPASLEGTVISLTFLYLKSVADSPPTYICGCARWEWQPHLDKCFSFFSPGTSGCKRSSKESYLVLSLHPTPNTHTYTPILYPFHSFSLFLSLHISRLIMRHNWSPLLILSTPDSAQTAQANFRGWHCWVLAIRSSQWAGRYFLSLSGSSPQVEITVNMACPRSSRLQKNCRTYFASLSFGDCIWHASCLTKLAFGCDVCTYSCLYIWLFAFEGTNHRLVQL